MKASEIKLILPIKIGDIVLKNVLKNFEKESFDNQTWQPRKDNDTSRNLLVKSGSLRRSIRVVQATWQRISIGTDVEYAQVHNEGLKAGRGSGFTMPKRTFLDIDKETEREIHNVIDVEFDKFFKQL